MLTMTPLIISAMTGAVSAQETPVAALNAQVAKAVARQSTAPALSMQVNLPSQGTYVFTAPSDSDVQVRIDGTVILDLSQPRSDVSAADVKVFTTLMAGTHIIEIIGDNVTPEKLAAISLNQVGMPAASLASLTDGFTTDTTQQSRTASLRSTTATRMITGQTSVSQVREMPQNNATGRDTDVMTASAVSTAPGRVIVPGSGAANQDNDEPDSVVRSVVRGAVSAILASRDVDSGGPGAAAGEATSSPLSPPSGVAVTQAVQIVGGATEEGVVGTTGQTMFGGVMDPDTYDTVAVSINQSETPTLVDVGPTTGQFAFRIFPEDVADGDVTVTLTGMSSSNEGVMTEPVVYNYTAGPINDGVSQVLSRITYGATADLYARVRYIGVDAYIEEQLRPENIRNAAFEAMDFDDLLDRGTTNSYRMFRSLERHNLAHAAFSDKQLQEAMGEFWSNHFHASTKDSGVRVQNLDDRIFFRENAMGRFEDLLLYSARSPLMSQFLDNDQSRAGRLNENYGREILELHTVGVDAGYSDEDVIAASRIFTGWNYRRTNEGAQDTPSLYEFEFRAGNHDTEDKVIPFLNTTIAGRSGGAGVEEGEEFIALLADDVRTHNYVCGKIVQRFVADVPPAEFVDICVTAWQASDGSSREILRAILTAPAFIETAEYQRAKGKTPFEYAASAIRAVGANPNRDLDPGFYERFLSGVENAGYKPVSFPVPTGLPEIGKAWVNSASLIAQYSGVNFAMERRDQFNIDLEDEIDEYGLETAEEVAAYLLAIATTDRYRRDEYEAVVSVLKGSDGIFEPMVRDDRERRALDRAVGLLVTLPSFQLQ